MVAAAEAGGAVVRSYDDCVALGLTKHGLSDPVCRGVEAFHLHHTEQHSETMCTGLTLRPACMIGTCAAQENDVDIAATWMG